jgi:coenzyme F420-reducing hydrogenase alpha subunit
VTNEYVVPQSTAKYTKFNRDSYFAGALARYNNNYKQLTPEALAVGKSLGLDGVNHNPFMNNVAQVVESVFSVQRIIDHIDWLLDNGLKKEDYSFEVREGQGAGANDVPRGILFHDYTYDKNGICVEANCIIPTNQNHANIQADFDKFVPEFMDKGEEELQFLMEMLVRAYDPCISCSTHLLNVEFKK